MNHSRLFAVLLFICFAAFQSHPAQAQIQSLYYSGPAFDPTYCLPDSDHTCESGNVTASVIVQGLTPGYTGHFTPTYACLSSLGFTLGPSDLAGTEDLDFTAGQLVGWTLGASRNTGTDPILQANIEGSYASD
jgi:hypothetical protein